MDAVDTVLFDMDETLVEHTSDAMEILTSLHTEFGSRLAPVEAQAFIRMLGGKANDMWHMMFDGVLSGDVARPYTFINTLRAFHLDESLANPLLEAFEDRLIASSRLTKGALEVLQSLRDGGVTIGVVTNGYAATQQRKAEHHGLHEYVDFILVSEDVGKHKPDSAIFEAALARAKTGAHRCVFVGDNLNADISGALNAGLTAVLYDPAGDKRETAEEEGPVPTHVISRLPDVLPLVGLASSRTAD